MYAAFIDTPVSGTYPEKHFGRITPACLWVKFTANNGEEWVGSFQAGWEKYLNTILGLDKHEKAFVIAGGLGYMIDVRTKEQKNTMEIAEIKSAITDNDQETICYSNGSQLCSIDKNGNAITLHNRAYFEEIKLVEIRDHKLYATYLYDDYDKTLYRLEIDILTKEVKDSFYDTARNEYVHTNPNPGFFGRIWQWFVKK